MQYLFSDCMRMGKMLLGKFKIFYSGLGYVNVKLGMVRMSKIRLD